MKKRLIIFDLDGTVLNTLEDLHASVNFALQSQNLPCRSIDEVRTFVGNGIFKLVCRSVPRGTGDDLTARVFDAFKAHYALHSMDMTLPYDGIPELLASLKSAGCYLGLVTNKADTAAQPIIARFFPQIFNCVAGEREGVRKKPAPDTVFEVMRRLDCTPSDTVYIGDSEVDLLTAKNAGCDCVAVSWGFRSREQLISCGAEIIADTAAELAEILEV